MTEAELPIQIPCGPDLPGAWAALRQHCAQGAPVLLTGIDALPPLAAAQFLEFFLHDGTVISRVEPFASLLSALIHRQELGLWDLLGAAADDHLRALPRNHPECLACPAFAVCQGYGTWAGSCETWRGLITGLAAAARELAHLRDLNRSNARGSHGHPEPN
jgi:hypothetical protein